jgi:hypothetical protein
MWRWNEVFAHVGGMPVEETATALLPVAAMVVLGMRVAAFRLRRSLSLRRSRPYR